MYHDNEEIIVVSEQKKSTRPGTWSKSDKEGDKLDEVPMSTKKTSDDKI